MTDHLLMGGGGNLHYYSSSRMVRQPLFDGATSTSILLIGGTKGFFALGGCYHGFTQCTVNTAPSNGKPLT
jgi:hypothetical protein